MATMEKLLTPNEVMALLQIKSKTTLYKLIHSQKLRPYKVGNQLRFSPSSVRSYLSKSRA